MKHAALLLICLIALIGVPVAVAQEVTAGLSSPTTTVGGRVELVVTVRGVRSAHVPESIQVPGLQIQLFGRSTRFEMHNFSMTSSLTYTYSVMPSKTGEFDIPPIEVRVGNKTLRTNPLRLHVSDASSMPLPPPTIPGGQLPAPGVAPAGGLPFFGDLVLSKKKAFVGEVVPAEVRFYFRSNIGGEVGDRPNLAGEGFTVQRFANMPKREQIVNGENYIVFAFQTALTPAKSGEITIPSASLDARLQVPGSVPPGFDDFFRNFGGVVPPGMFTNARDVAVETRSASLNVVSLPSEGRPADFSGAIGKFQIKTSVTPTKVGPGEPVTLRVVVSGQGNFDAMGAPVLEETGGWRSYPPTETFKATDAINFSGQKTYEYLLVARTDQTITPRVAFNYFDPSSGKYVSLAGDPLSVVAPAAAASPTPVVVSTDQPGATAEATPKQQEESGKPDGATSWIPWIAQSWFLAANAVAALVWLLILIGGLLRRASRSPASSRKKRLKRLEAELATLDSADDAVFLTTATAILHGALQTEEAPLEAYALLDDFDEGTAVALRDLLARNDEAKYAPSSLKALDRASRDRIRNALKSLLA